MANFLKEQQKRSENWEEHYPGNIWGWKFSLVGLVILLFLVGLIVYRHVALDIPFGFEEQEKIEKHPHLEND